MKAIRGVYYENYRNGTAYGCFSSRRASHLVSGTIPFRFLKLTLFRTPTAGNRRRSDSAVKQILLTMNEKESFIIEDLDDHHVVIKADEEYRVRRQLEAEVRTRCSEDLSKC